MYKIGFIGCGNMGSAMVSSLIQKGVYAPEEILVSHLTEKGAARSRETYGVDVTLDNRRVAAQTRLLVLAVKPQFYEEVLVGIQAELTPDHLLVGIAPGKTLEWLREKSGCAVKTARFMPNTPAMVLEGMTAICTDENLSAEETDELKKIAGSFGRFELIPERLMDAAGAVGGCSPAFVYMFIEAMADAAVLQGMPRKMAYDFAAQAVLGSAKMVLETGLHPGVLKDQVCSPGGTTIEGVRMLEKAGMRSAGIEALTSSAEKGRRM